MKSLSPTLYAGRQFEVPRSVHEFTFVRLTNKKASRATTGDMLVGVYQDGDVAIFGVVKVRLAATVETAQPLKVSATGCAAPCEKAERRKYAVAISLEPGTRGGIISAVLVKYGRIP